LNSSEEYFFTAYRYLKPIHLFNVRPVRITASAGTRLRLDL